MDFRYSAEAEAFRREFRAWLDENLTDETRGEWPRRFAGHRRRSPRTLTRLEPHARRRPLRGDRVARAMGRPRRGRVGTGRVRRGDAPRARTGHAESTRPLEHRACDHRARHRGAKARAPPPHAPRRRHLVPGFLRAERGIRPRVAADLGRARRRHLDRERAEDVEHARPPRELVRAARTHRSERAEAQGHHVPARRHDACRASRSDRSRRSPASASSTRSSSPTCACPSTPRSGHPTKGGASR